MLVHLVIVSLNYDVSLNFGTSGNCKSQFMKSSISEHLGILSRGLNFAKRFRTGTARYGLIKMRTGTASKNGELAQNGTTSKTRTGTARHGLEK